MSAQTDFHFSLDRACGLTVDATCAVRAASLAPLPHPHRRLVRVAIVALERAQDALFQARNDPWHPQPQSPKPQQLELL